MAASPPQAPGVVADSEFQSYTTLQYKNTAINWRGMIVDSRGESEELGAESCACVLGATWSMEGPSMIAVKDAVNTARQLVMALLVPRNDAGPAFGCSARRIRAVGFALP